MREQQRNDETTGRHYPSAPTGRKRCAICGGWTDCTEAPHGWWYHPPGSPIADSLCGTCIRWAREQFRPSQDGGLREADPIADAHRPIVYLDLQAMKLLPSPADPCPFCGQHERETAGEFLGMPIIVCPHAPSGAAGFAILDREGLAPRDSPDLGSSTVCDACHATVQTGEIYISQKHEDRALCPACYEDRERRGLAREKAQAGKR